MHIKKCSRINTNELPYFIKSDDFNLFIFLEHPDYQKTNHKPLKSGELVICDLDMVYVKGDPDMLMELQDVKKLIKENRAEKYKFKKKPDERE